MPSPIAVRRDTGSSNPHSGTTQQDETSAGPAARPNQKGHPTPDKQVDGPNQKTTQNRKIPMTKLTASTDSTAKPRARKVAKSAATPAIDVASSWISDESIDSLADRLNPMPTKVSDDLLDQYADMLSPVPPPPVANQKVFSARVAAPIDGDDGEAGPESIGLGIAVGVVVAGEAMGQGLNILGRGLARLLR
jgi:hypothetical protein